MKNNGRKKAILIIIGLLALFCVTTAAFDLKKERDRAYNPVHLSEWLKHEIKEETQYLPPFKVVIYAKEKTNKLLKFSTKCEPFDDRRVTKMHCVGYAQVYSTICNYAFKVNKIKGYAKPVVGYVKWNGINLNKFSRFLPGKWKSFTKDHDFVEVEYENDFKLYVDPLLDIVNWRN